MNDQISSQFTSVKTQTCLCYLQGLHPGLKFLVMPLSLLILAPLANGQQAPHFDRLVFDTNQPSLSLSGQAGSNYVIETSFDLIHWTFLYSGDATNGHLDLLQPGSTVANQQFYRAHVDNSPTAPLTNLVSIADTNMTISTLITPEGGNCFLQLDGDRQVTLSFASNAVPEAQYVTITLLTNITGLPFGRTILGAVQIQPDNLNAMGAATLTFIFDPGPGFDRRQVVSFAANADGSQFRLCPDSVATNSASMAPTRGGIYGCCVATTQELNRVASGTPSSAALGAKSPRRPRGAGGSGNYLNASELCFPERVSAAESIRQNLQDGLDRLSASVANSIAQARRSEPSDAKDDGTLPGDLIGMQACLFYDYNIRPLFAQVQNNCSLLKVLAGITFGIARQVQLFGYNNCTELLSLSDLPLCAGARACLEEIKQCCHDLPSDRDKFRIDLLSVIRQQELLGITSQPGCFDVGDAEVEQTIKDCSDLPWNGIVQITEKGNVFDRSDASDYRKRERNTVFVGTVSAVFATGPSSYFITASGDIYYDDKDTTFHDTICCGFVPSFTEDTASGTNQALIVLTLQGSGTNMTYNIHIDNGIGSVPGTTTTRSAYVNDCSACTKIRTGSSGPFQESQLLPTLFSYDGKVESAANTVLISGSTDQDNQWDIEPTKVHYQWDLWQGP